MKGLGKITQLCPKRMLTLQKEGTPSTVLIYHFPISFVKTKGVFRLDKFGLFKG